MLRLLDLRLAWRTLAKSPTLLIVATLSLGLGVGVNTTLYSVFRVVFLLPPTATDVDRLVKIEPGNGNQISWPNVRDLARGETFDGFAAYAMTRLNLRTGDTDQKVLALMVSPGFFDLLGARPAIGRPLASEVDAAVVTEAFRRRHLDDRPDPTGAVIMLNGRAHHVIGVLAADYRAVTGARGPEVYVPISEAIAPGMDDRRRAMFTLLARLAPGVSTQQAAAAITTQARTLESLSPTDNAGFARAAFVFPVSGLGSWQTRDLPTPALAAIASVPFAIFALVLLIACANVAGLLLARGVSRRRELAIRLALGASRPQVVATLLAESVLLATLGAAAGLALTWWLCRVASATALPLGVGPIHVSPDVAVLGYTLCLAALVTLACGLLPALAATRRHALGHLQHESSGIERRLGSRRLLVVGQVAVATTLLFVSILVLRSLQSIGDAEPGFTIDGVVTAHIELDPGRYTADQRSRLAVEALEAARAAPGVASASLTNLIPLGGDVNSTAYTVDGGDAPRVSSYVMHVGPDYFRTLNVRLRQGRDISLADRAGAPEVAIVNAAFVRAHGLTASPLGARVRNHPTAPWLEIVGVVDDSRYAFFGERPRPILYRSFLQAGGALRIVARGAAPATLVPTLRHTLAALDRHALVAAQTLREATSFEASLRRAGSMLLGGLGLLGLGLALIGVYGLLSYTVAQRTREMGIRMALGASSGRVRRLVLRSAVTLVGFGVAIGTLVTLVAMQPLAFLLSDVRVSDPTTIAVTTALFFGAGLAAAWLPSLRATRINPIVALRVD
jgi:putative ABC transport system permease protein